MTDTTPDWENKIQNDLDNGNFNRICGNETLFKNYVFPIIQKAREEGFEAGVRENVIKMDAHFAEFLKGDGSKFSQEIREKIVKEARERTIEEIRARVKRMYKDALGIHDYSGDSALFNVIKIINTLK